MFCIYRDTDPFDLYHYGMNVSKEPNFMETFEDKLRQFSEECDHLQVSRIYFNKLLFFNLIFDLVKIWSRAFNLWSMPTMGSVDSQAPASIYSKKSFERRASLPFFHSLTSRTRYQDNQFMQLFNSIWKITKKLLCLCSSKKRIRWQDWSIHHSRWRPYCKTRVTWWFYHSAVLSRSFPPANPHMRTFRMLTIK